MAAGKAGSLLIDIAANTAQLKKDMADAQASVAQLQKTVEGAANIMKASFAAIAGREVLNYIVELTKAVGDLAEQAQRVGLATGDFQAFTVAMQKAGASASEASATLASGARFIDTAFQGNKRSIDLLNQLKVTIQDTSGAAKPLTTDFQAIAQAILRINDPLKQAAATQEIFHKNIEEMRPILQQVAGGFDNLRAAAGAEIIPDSTIQRFKDFETTVRTIQRTALADLAVALDNVVGAKAGDSLAKFKKDFDDLGQSIRVFSSSGAGEALGAIWGTFLLNIDLAIKATNLLIQLLTAIPGLLDKAWAKIKEASANAQQFAKDTIPNAADLSTMSPGSPDPGKQAAERKAAEDAAVKGAQETADKITAIRKDAFDREQQRQITALNTRVLRAGPGEQYGPPPPPTGGTNPLPRSTGAAKPDYFENTLKGIQDQTKAVTQATTDLAASSGLATKEAERLAQLQIDIAQHTAAAVKAAHATTPQQKADIAAAVADLDNAKYKLADFKQVLATADQVQSTFGDGSKALADRLEYLQKALDANKISQGDYEKAVTAATEAQAIQAEQSKGLAGGFDGIVAGWNKAALAASGAGAEMKLGEQAFTQTFSLMSNAISEFVTTGQVDFSKLAASFATMLANMAIQWAAAGFLRNLGLGAAGGGGVPFGPPAPATAGVMSAGFRATGGDVLPGRAYTVGEHGPERFIPKMPGTIMAANSNTGNPNVAVNVDMSGNNSGAPDPRQTVEFARRVRAAVVDTISSEKRPGGILYTRQSA
jgi:hypothetical protein